MENYKKLNADSRISHVIDRKARENAQAQIAHTDMYIAKGKKTGVVLALEAMAKAGWIVDSQGVRVKSTGKAVEQILDIVFNDKKCENARQILSHAKNVNKKDFSSYFKELSDSLSGRV